MTYVLRVITSLYIRIMILILYCVCIGVVESRTFDEVAKLCCRKSFTQCMLSLCLTLYVCSLHAIDRSHLQRRMHVEQVGYKG